MGTEVKSMIPRPDPDNYDLDTPSDRIEFGIEAMMWWESLPQAELRSSCFRTKGIYLNMEPFQVSRSAKIYPENICFVNMGGAARCAVEGWTPYNFFSDQTHVTYMYGEGHVEKQHHLVNDLEKSLHDAMLGGIDLMFLRMGIGMSKGEKYNRCVRGYTCDDIYINRLCEEMGDLSNTLRAGGY